MHLFTPESSRQTRLRGSLLSLLMGEGYTGSWGRNNDYQEERNFVIWSGMDEHTSVGTEPSKWSEEKHVKLTIEGSLHRRGIES